MEPQRGKKANRAARNLLRRKGKTMVLGDRRARENIDSPGAALEQAMPLQASQIGACDSQRLNIARTDQLLPGGEVQDAIGRTHVLSVGSFPYLPTDSNTLGYKTARARAA